MLDAFLAKYQNELPALTRGQIGALEAHLDLLERWNRTINLTAIGKSEAVSKHLGESLFLAAHLPMGPVTACDLGSGGGFPGIPVAIARPDCQISLIESDMRKGVFLREASRKLPNVRVVSARYETIQGDFDWLICRAVNLFKTFHGPKCAHAAFIGGSESGPVGSAKRSAGAAFRWRTTPIPWDSAGFLSIGERFT